MSTPLFLAFIPKTNELPGGNGGTPLSTNPTTNAPITTVLGIAFGILGAIALLLIVIAAFKLITSRGEPQAVAKARNTILYAAIGLFVILTAYGIVAFVINRIT